MNKRYVFNSVFGIFFTLIIAAPNLVFAAPLITAHLSNT